MSDPRRKKRRPVPPAQQCSREGCTARRTPGYSFCSELCQLVHDQLLTIEELCTDLGPGTASTNTWMAAVALNDALTTFVQESRRAFGVQRDRQRKQAATTPRGVAPAPGSGTGGLCG